MIAPTVGQVAFVLALGAGIYAAVALFFCC